MRFLRYIFCALLFVTASVADTININWINGDETYAQTTCEIGGDLILPETPTKRGYTFKGWGAGYTRLEYIESSGTQYIVIPHKLNSTENVNVKYMVTAVNTSEIASIPFGVTSQPSISDAKEGCTRTLTGSANFNRVGYGDGDGTVRDIDTHANLNTWYEVEYKPNGECYINGGLVATLPISTWTAAYNFALFGRMTEGNVKFKIIGRIAHCMIGNSVSAIPVKRNSDNVIGMYDTVSKTFFTNAGTGEFIAGPVAEDQNFYE